MLSVKGKHIVGWLWPLYLLLNYTIARNYGESIQLFIWLGLIPPLLGTMYVIHKKGFSIGIELKLFIFMLFWSLLSAVVAGNFDEKYLRFLLQFTLVFYFVALTVTFTKLVKIYFWVFWFIGVYNTYELLKLFNWNMGAMLFRSGRQMGLFTSENLLGIYCAIGVMGGLSLVGFKNNIIFKILIIIGIPISLIGVIASGSRGGLLMVGFYVLWWAFIIMRKRLGNLFIWFILIIVLSFASYKGYTSLFRGTIIENRISTTEMGADQGEGEARWVLIKKGYYLGLTHPIFGVSFGGFRNLSGTGFDYAHNDFADVIASLGFLGLILYLLIHWVVGKRLWKSLKVIEDGETHYLAQIGFMILLSLVLSAAIFRPNFTALDVWISFGLAVGISRIVRNEVIAKKSP